MARHSLGTNLVPCVLVDANLRGERSPQFAHVSLDLYSDLRLLPGDWITIQGERADDCIVARSWPLTDDPSLIRTVLFPAKLASSCVHISKMSKYSAESSLSIDKKSVQPAEPVLAGLDSTLQRLVTAYKSGHSVLLSGAPGVGKTTLVHALAKLVHAPVYILEVFMREHCHEYVPGEQGALQLVLDKFFDLAMQTQLRSNLRCVLFLDELDTICAGSLSGDVSHESRVTAHVIRLISQVHDVAMIIGATNRPFVIDPMVRSPGRLDVEVHVPVPTASVRAAILQFYLSSPAITIHPTVTQEWIHMFSRQFLIGYTGADIRLLVAKGTEMAAETTEQLSAHILVHVAREVQPSILRGFSVAYPEADSALSASGADLMSIATNIDAVVHGLADAKRSLMQSIVWPLLFSADLMRMGISASAGVLLYGPPGCAKTTLVRAFARFSQATFVSLAAADVFSPFVGAAEAVVRQAFARARQCSPCVIFIDEIDSLVGNRGEHTSEVNSRVLATLLNEMDGIDTSTSEDDRVIVVGATNRPWAIDAALLRPGRLDSLIFVGLPDDECRQRMTQMFLKTVPHERGEEIVQTVVRRTEGWTGAEVEQMLREAVFHSWRNSHATQIEPLLSLEDVLTAIAAVQPAVTNDVVGQYIRFADNRVS